ncbi:hypothetical protein ABK040_001778 [Willaertia magna]
MLSDDNSDLPIYNRNIEESKQIIEKHKHEKDDCKKLHKIITDMSKLKHTVLQGLEESIKRFTEYIQTKTNDTNFNFYTDLLPSICQWSLERNVETIKIIEAHEEIEFTPKEIRSILANSFLLNTRNSANNKKVGILDFYGLYLTMKDSAIQRIICQLSYFYIQLHHEDIVMNNRDNIIIKRIKLKKEPDWLKSNLTIDNNFIKKQIALHTGNMEEPPVKGFVDFANCQIHIGQIIPSLTQEEVLFSCCPECFITLLNCETLNDDEVVIIKNVMRYSDYTGYSLTFKFNGLYEPLGRVHDVLVVDATTCDQFTTDMIKRDLNKAYMSFNGIKEGISTGKWGCGVFGGDLHLKFCQQICAIRLTENKLYFSTYNDTATCKEFNELLELMVKSKMTVGKLVSIMMEYNENKAKKGKFGVYLKQQLQK